MEIAPRNSVMQVCLRYIADLVDLLTTFVVSTDCVLVVPMVLRAIGNDNTRCAIRDDAMVRSSSLMRSLVHFVVCATKSTYPVHEFSPETLQPRLPL